MKKSTSIYTFLFVCVSFSLISFDAHAIISMSRDEIISRAATGVGSSYWWGHSCWRSWDRSWGGADCSGYVARVWNIPMEVATDYNCSYHPYGTWHMRYQSTDWTHINRSNTTRGDALVSNDGSSGHVVIYASGDAWGCPEVYEAQCTNCGIRHHTRCFDSSYVAIQRKNLSIQNDDNNGGGGSGGCSTNYSIPGGSGGPFIPLMIFGCCLIPIRKRKTKKQ